MWLIQAGTSCEPKGITDLLNIYMFAVKLFNATISSRTIHHAHQTLEKAMDYVQKLEREVLLVEGIQICKGVLFVYI